MGKMLPNGFTERQKLKANTNTITWKSRMTIILCILIGLVMCKLTELVVLWTKPRWRQRTITNTKAITWGCPSQTLLSKLALIPLINLSLNLNRKLVCKGNKHVKHFNTLFLCRWQYLVAIFHYQMFLPFM